MPAGPAHVKPTASTGQRAGALGEVPPDLDVPALRQAVLAWYDVEGRALPFRGATDPWAILVSEAMAQQTQAARAGEAWSSFMHAFPTPAKLAAASPADALRAWRGLGYNRRALALRAAAVEIVREHDGRLPDDLDALLRLPGVGPYTARAVAALAYGRPVGAVDTNVRRVVRRVAGPNATTTPRAVQALADALADPDRPGAWTQALMDVGATVCRGSRPDCPACPLARWCHTARGENQAPQGEAGPHDRVAGERRAARSRQLLGPPVRRGHIARESRARFSTTARWLRGRLVDRLRDAVDAEWVRIDGVVGDHGPVAVAAAVEALERDGLLERHPDDRGLVRLPTLPSEVGAPR